jgi:hypothetical protein
MDSNNESPREFNPLAVQIVGDVLEVEREDGKETVRVLSRDGEEVLNTVVFHLTDEGFSVEGTLPVRSLDGGIPPIDDIGFDAPCCIAVYEKNPDGGEPLPTCQLESGTCKGICRLRTKPEKFGLRYWCECT